MKTPRNAHIVNAHTGRLSNPNHQEIPKKKTEEEMQGCLPVLFWPLALSLLVTASLILTGFVIHVLSRLTDIRLRALWILCSLAAGGAVYFLFSRFKSNRS